MKRIFRTLLLCSSLIFCSSVLAKEKVNLADDSVRDILIVSGTGAMGAIIGLSTLSFVEEPSENFRNIYAGLAIGVMVGVAAVVYLTANKSSDIPYTKLTPDFSTYSRVAWHKEKSNQYIEKNLQALPKFQFNFSF